MVRQGSRTYYVSDAEFVRSSYDSGEFVPLYGLEALAAERERLAKLCVERAQLSWAAADQPYAAEVKTQYECVADAMEELARELRA